MSESAVTAVAGCRNTRVRHSETLCRSQPADRPMGGFLLDKIGSHQLLEVRNPHQPLKGVSRSGDVVGPAATEMELGSRGLD